MLRSRFVLALVPSLVLAASASAGCGPILGLGDYQDPQGTGGASSSSGGAGGATSSASGGATSSSSGAGGCSAPTDCPMPANACLERVCTQGKCGTSDTPAGTATAQQTKGDCKEQQCDGKGGTKIVPKDSDVDDDKNDCTDDLCSMGKPVHPPKAAHTACIANLGHYCDGAGTCVECTEPADCPSLVCSQYKCVSAQCGDMVQNGLETDIDCGGGTCSPCKDGLRCHQASDCLSGVCAGGFCQAPLCNDGVQNGGETATDCGGAACPPCADGLGCKGAGDCKSGVCLGAVCQKPTCVDGVKNGFETGIDCGGAAQGSGCPGCADGTPCGSPAECSGMNCFNGACCTPKTCAGLGATCGMFGDGCGATLACDGVKDGAETDVDCGGASCPKCGMAQHCNGNADCISLACNFNICCDSNCTAPCHSCVLPNQVGHCAAISGQNDAFCTAANLDICFKGTCLGGIGHSCTLDSQCGTKGGCNMFTKKCQ